MLEVYDTAYEAFEACVHRVMQNGHDVSPRTMSTREITSHSFAILNPRNRLIDPPGRPIRRGYGAAKLAWDLAESDSVAVLEPWNPHAKRFSDDGEHVQGEDYGVRFTKFLNEAMELLSADPYSRRAWVPIYDGHRDLVVQNGGVDQHPSRKSSNVPCTIGFGLRIVADQLIMQTVMRSQSVIGVMPYDIFLLTSLQELIANELDVELGHYEHTMLSCHIYEREFDIADRIIDAPPFKYAAMEPIEVTLSEARMEYPLALMAIMQGGGPVGDVDDPIIRLLVDNRPEVAA